MQMPDRIASHPEELADFEPRQEDLLSDLPEYRDWHRKALDVYNQVARVFPDFEYRPYQYQYAALYACRPKNLCAGSQGAGKTLISAVHLRILYPDLDRSRPGRVQIACPNRLAVARWQEDLGFFFDNVAYIHSEKDLYRTEAPIWIYTLDFPKRKRKGLNERFAKWIKKHARPNCLIVDEIHNCRAGSMRTRYIEYLMLASKRVLGLTGTPSDGDLLQMGHLCRLIYHRDFPYTPKQFNRAYGAKRQVKSGYLKGKDGDSNKHLRHLNPDRFRDYYDLMRRFMHRAKLDDPQIRAYISFPQPITKTAVVTADPDQQQAYNDQIQQVRDYLAQLNNVPDHTVALRILQPLLRIANTYRPDIPKVQRLVELVRQCPGQTAIFVSGVACGDMLETALSENGFSPTRLHAKLGPDDRLRVKERFQLGEVDAGIFSANLAAESINLTQASQVIFYDLTWSSVKAQQSISRAIRPGNRAQSVPIWFLATEGMADEHQLTLLWEKIRLNELLLDYDTSDFDQTDLNAGRVLEMIHRQHPS